MRRIARIAIVAGIIAVAAPVGPAVAGGGCHAAGSGTARTTEVIMRGNCFHPTVAHVTVGAAVRWVNEDATGHTVTGVGWGSADEFGTAAKTRSVRFGRAGVYPYYCLLHPWMAGAVVVGDPGVALDPVPRSDAVEPVSNDSSVKVAATSPASSGPARPALAVAIALAVGGVGFGIGRGFRSRRPGRAVGG